MLEIPQQKGGGGPAKALQKLSTPGVRVTWSNYSQCLVTTGPFISLPLQRIMKFLSKTRQSINLLPLASYFAKQTKDEGQTNRSQLVTV